jgi:hypothetical protein
VSWIRNWLNRAKQDQTQEPAQEHASRSGDQTSQPPPGASSDEDHRQGFHIRDAERRQLRRLLRRQDDLTYDLERAEESLNEENQWTERIEQLNQAIEQAMADREAIEPEDDTPPRMQLEPIPVEIAELTEEEPASVTLRIGSTEISYREEIDWAERGHNVTMPELLRVSGDVEPLLPELDSEERVQELREHLLHSLSTYSNQILEHSAAGGEPPAMTLADITRTCPACGGWLDQKNRCPICAELNWKRQEIDADLRRLRKERDDVISDLERQRDRLPIIQRQLAETRADIDKLREKGVEPAS